MFDPSRPPSCRAFLKAATYFESCLVLAAYLVGWAGGVDPLASLRFDWAALAWGAAGTVPLALVFFAAYRLPSAGLGAIRRLLVERLGPLLDACHWSGLVYLGLLAGVTEEILFRGAVQPLLERHWGWAAGMAGSNLLFALAHAVTPLYAVLAGLTGLYLGLSLDVGGGRNLLVPVAIHALYDCLAFLAVARFYRAGHDGAFLKPPGPGGF